MKCLYCHKPLEYIDSYIGQYHPKCYLIVIEKTKTVVPKTK